MVGLSVWTYRGGLALATIFTLGYATHCYLSPSSANYHLSRAESEIRKKPAENARVINEMSEFSREMTAKMRRQDDPMYVPYGDLKLEITGDISCLVNTKTGEEHPVKYEDGRMVVDNSASCKAEYNADDAANR